MSDTLHYIHASEPGVYYAFVYSAEGCMTISEVYAAVNTGDLQDIGVIVYPNPATDIFFISAAGLGESFILMDAFGRIVLSDLLVDIPAKVNVNALSNGIYLLRVMHNNGVEIWSRVVISHK